MPKAKTFTFKRGTKSTGLARITNPHPQVYIFLAGKKVGFIQPPTRYNGGKWEVFLRLHRPPENIKPEDPCTWFNARLQTNFNEEAEAKAWLKENSQALQEQHPIAPEED